MHHIRYELEAGSTRACKDYIEIATTRPETLLGDTAVACHPDDERYKALVGKTVKLPLTDRLIPIIADAYVDRDFGTGLVKITPAHDPNDFEVGKRHELAQINILNPDGTLSDAVPAKYRGLKVKEARKARRRGPQGRRASTSPRSRSRIRWGTATAAAPSSSPTFPSNGSCA